MGLLSWMGRALIRTEHKFDPLWNKVYETQLGRPVWMERTYEAYSREGYQKCSVVFKCIHTIARNASKVPLQVFNGDELMDDSDELVKLLKKPNPFQAGAAFWEAFVAYHLLSGNGFLHQVGPDMGDGTEDPAEVTELYLVRPDWMGITPGKNCPDNYIFKSPLGQEVKFRVNESDGTSAIIQWKAFNPLSQLFGQSYMLAAANAADTYNDTVSWNKSLLQNSARPPGAFSLKAAGANVTGNLSEGQRQRLEQQIEERAAGPRNAGRPFILEGGMDWTSIGMSPGEMEWLEGKDSSAREIAYGFDFPPVLLGLKGDSTYSNGEEGRQGLYEDCILPLLDSMLDEMNLRLCPKFGEDYKIKYDESRITALAPRRAKTMVAAQAAEFLSVNEKRKMCGLEDYDPDMKDKSAADEIYVSAGLVPLSIGMNEPTPPEGVDQSGDAALANEGDQGSEGDANGQSDGTQPKQPSPFEKELKALLAKPGRDPMTGKVTQPAAPAKPQGPDSQALKTAKELLEAVANKELPPEAVKPLLMTLLPQLGKEQVDAMLASLEGFEPPKPELPPELTGGKKPKPGEPQDMNPPKSPLMKKFIADVMEEVKAAAVRGDLGKFSKEEDLHEGNHLTKELTGRAALTEKEVTNIKEDGTGEWVAPNGSVHKVKKMESGAWVCTGEWRK